MSIASPRLENPRGTLYRDCLRNQVLTQGPKPSGDIKFEIVGTGEITPRWYTPRRIQRSRSKNELGLLCGPLAMKGISLKPFCSDTEVSNNQHASRFQSKLQLLEDRVRISVKEHVKACNITLHCLDEMIQDLKSGYETGPWHCKRLSELTDLMAFCQERPKAAHEGNCHRPSAYGQELQASVLRQICR